MKSYLNRCEMTYYQGVNENLQFHCEIANNVEPTDNDLGQETTSSALQPLVENLSTQEAFEDESILGVDYLTNAKWMSDGNDVSKGEVFYGYFPV